MVLEHLSAERTHGGHPAAGPGKQKDSGAMNGYCHSIEKQSEFEAMLIGNDVEDPGRATLALSRLLQSSPDRGPIKKRKTVATPSPTKRHQDHKRRKEAANEAGPFVRHYRDGARQSRANTSSPSSADYEERDQGLDGKVYYQNHQYRGSGDTVSATFFDQNPLPKRSDYLRYAKQSGASTHKTLSKDGAHASFKKYSQFYNGGSLSLSSDADVLRDADTGFGHQPPLHLMLSNTAANTSVGINDHSMSLMSEFSDGNDTTLTGIGTELPALAFPSYNASKLSTTMIPKESGSGCRKSKHGLSRQKVKSFALTSSPAVSSSDALLDESSDIMFESSDFAPSSSQSQPYDDDNNDRNELESEMSIDEYIKHENSTFQEEGDGSSDGNATIDDLDETPIFKKNSPLTRRTSRFGIFQSSQTSNNSSSFCKSSKNNNNSSESDFDFKLDSFGRLSTNGNEVNILNGLSSELSTDESDVAMRGKNTFSSSFSSSLSKSSVLAKKNKGDLQNIKGGLKAFSFSEFKSRKQKSKHGASKSKSVSRFSLMGNGPLNTVKREFSRTNSTNEEANLKLAKNAISHAIDEGNPVVELEKLELRYVPDEIEDMNNLVCLDPLSREIYQPEIKVYLSNNRLVSVNPRLFNIKNLTVLSLRNNKLTSLPGKIKNCHKLQYLQLAGNRLKYLPHEILSLKSLQMLSVWPNPELIDFKKYCQTHKVQKVIMNTNDRSSAMENSQFVKRFVGELQYNPKVINNRNLKLPKLSELCLRKFENYNLSIQEIKMWSQHLSKSHLKLINQSLLKLLNENICYNCSKVLINKAVGLIVEFYDVCEVRLVPIRKEFCCQRCMDDYVRVEREGEVLEEYEPEESPGSLMEKSGSWVAGGRSASMARTGSEFGPGPLLFNEDF